MLHLYCLVQLLFGTGRRIGREASGRQARVLAIRGTVQRLCGQHGGERSASTSGDVGTGRRQCWQHLRSSPGGADAEGDLSETEANGDGIRDGICGGIVRLTLFYR
jgi:hypothetical protein